jgi:NAD(P)-dependent dehydrogenase (short-subunit alcohol dehydrogenase family)
VGFATSKVLVSTSDTYHVIISSRTLEKAVAAKSELEAAGIKGTLSAIQLDVTDEESIEAAAALVQQQFGRLDVLVNNAGLAGMDPDLKTRYKRCLETNVIGPAMVAAVFRPLLLKASNPYSIFVSSGARTLTREAAKMTAAHTNIKYGDAYQVSKAALNMVAIVEHRDHGSKGLKVFAMSPGFVRSNLRGTSEEERSGWGGAGDPEGSGEIVLGIVQGKRDAEVGCLVHKDGIYPW